MKPLSSYRNQELRLVQPSQMKRECELHSPDGILLKAYFPSWRKSNAVVEGFDAKWIIRKPSVWRSDIEVCKDGFNYPIATYRGHIFKASGVIHLQRGLRLSFESKTFKSIFTVFSDTKEVLIQFKQTGVFRKKTELTLGRRKTEIIDEYPWLTMLLWYIMLNNQRQSIAGGYNS